VPGQGALSAHLLIDRLDHWPAILAQARVMLNRDYSIEHVTLQPEYFVPTPRAGAIPIRAE